MARDPIFSKQVANIRRRLIGKSFLGSIITKVGIPVDKRRNCPTLIPVQLANGHYALIWQEHKEFLTPLVSNNAKIERMLKRCRKMPDVRGGIGSGVMHLWLYPRNQNVKFAFCKLYYNDKAEGDTYREITWAEDARNREETRIMEEEAAASAA